MVHQWWNQFLICCIYLVVQNQCCDAGEIMLMGATTIREALLGLVEVSELERRQMRHILLFVKDLGMTETEHAVVTGLEDDTFARQALIGYLDRQTALGLMSEETKGYIRSLLSLEQIVPITAPAPTNYNAEQDNGIVKYFGRWQSDDPVGGIYNGIWGFAKGFKEYALVCKWNGLDVVDITNSAKIFLAQSIRMPGGSTWRDAATHTDSSSGKTYAYVAAQSGGSANLWIVNLSDLPVRQQYWNDMPSVPSSLFKMQAGYLDDGHTLNVDAGLLFLNTAYRARGIKILDLEADPFDPPMIAQYLGGDGHDSLVLEGVTVSDLGKRTLLVAADGNFRLQSFVDITDIRSDYESNGNTVVQLSTRLSTTNSISSQYAHSNAVSADGNYLYIFEENNSFDCAIYDISDVLNPVFVKFFQWSGEGDLSNARVHNGRVRGDYLFIAYYVVGLRVFDISDPTNPLEVGHYETLRDPDGDGVLSGSVNSAFDGAWNVYTDLPSGNILVSDTDNGLFVVNIA